MHTQNYLIVGGSTGIGLEIVRLLLAEGHQLWVTTRTPKPELEPLQVNTIIWNATDSFKNHLESLPPILHGVVYCPGTINLKPFHRLTREEFLQDFQVNVLGAVEILQTVYSKLKNAQSASVVLFSTVAAKLGMNFHSAIATAKAAVEGLAKALAAEWASQNIRVNVVAPSLTDTPLAQKLLSDEAKREAAAKRHPLLRFGTPQDVAHIVHFLLSDKASWITGQIIGVDGGMGNLKP